MDFSFLGPLARSVAGKVVPGIRFTWRTNDIDEATSPEVQVHCDETFLGVLPRAVDLDVRRSLLQLETLPLRIPSSFHSLFGKSQAGAGRERSFFSVALLPLAGLPMR